MHEDRVLLKRIRRTKGMRKRSSRKKIPEDLVKLTCRRETVIYKGANLPKKYLKQMDILGGSIKGEDNTTASNVRYR